MTGHVPMIAPSDSRATPWRLHELTLLPECARGGHVLMGNFDGVHLGHRQVIQHAVKLASVDGRPVVAITFEPHPREDLSPREDFSRITSLQEKTRLLREAGVDHVVTLLFDTDVATLKPEDFYQEIVLHHFQPISIVTGLNCSASAEALAEIGSRTGVAVAIIPMFRLMEDEEPVTSSRIRSYLVDGNITAANQLLGRRWTIDGIVVHGDKRGRQLGFPTANLTFRSDARFRFGIYAVRVLIGGRILCGVASYGTRPQFDDGAPRLEIHILDFTGDLYGEPACVEFVSFQRPELTFTNVAALLQQMNADCVDARRLLSADSLEPQIESLLERQPQLDATVVAG